MMRPGPIVCLAAIALIALALPGEAAAQNISIDLGDEADGSITGRLVQIVLLMTVLSIAPSILIMVTSFTRIIVVLSFLRTAMGIQQAPPNMVLISLAMFLTFFIMAPTFEAAWNQGLQPLMNEEIDEQEAFTRSTAPFRDFMLANVREADVDLFAEMNGDTAYETPDAVPLKVLVPAFMISELRRAFEIGFLLFVPFLIIDMVIASILMAMGMMMLPPVMISLPFKIIFFVLVDGWHLVAGSLVQSYAPGV